MVIVNGKVCVKIGLFGISVVFLSVRYSRYNGSFEVYIERELESISFVYRVLISVIYFAVRILAVVDVRRNGYDIFRVVFKVMVESRIFDVYRRSVNRAAGAVRFSLVVFGASPYDFARCFLDRKSVV